MNITDNELKNYINTSNELDNPIYNRALAEKFDWLIPRNVWSGKKITDCTGTDGEDGFWPGAPEEHPDYDYSYTELNNIPDGWRKAFGWTLVCDIDAALTPQLRERFYITDIKEKWGVLRISTSYVNGALSDVLHQYEEASQYVCIACGQRATHMTTDWISPLCDDCWKKLKERQNQ